MKIAYENENVTLWHGDCREWSGNADAVLTDPPYGKKPLRPQSAGLGTPFSRSFDHHDCTWDTAVDADQIGRLLAIGQRHIVWGGQYYALPPTNCWLVWDKHQQLQFARFEMAWTDLTISNKLIDLPWLGAAARRQEPAYHPTQKPEAVMKWCFGFLPETDVVLDPFCGSGTTLIAALETGRKAIGIEIDERWVDVAVKRMERWHAQGRLDFGAANRN